jgi:hypothetical protein
MPIRCECPENFKKDPKDPKKCIPERKLPLRPCHYNSPSDVKPGELCDPTYDVNNEDAMESVPAGIDNIGRKTKIQLLSVSPLDRLLNQMN